MIILSLGYKQPITLGVQRRGWTNKGIEYYTRQSRPGL